MSKLVQNFKIITLESILKYYNRYILQANNIIQATIDSKVTVEELHFFLRELIFSITNSKGDYYSFIKLYEFDKNDGFDFEDECFKDDFYKYSLKILDHIKENPIILNFDIEKKIIELKSKDKNFNFINPNFKNFALSIEISRQLNRQELIAELQKYIAISWHYIQISFYKLEMIIDEIYSRITSNFQINKEKKSNNNHITSNTTEDPFLDFSNATLEPQEEDIYDFSKEKANDPSVLFDYQIRLHNPVNLKSGGNTKTPKPKKKDKSLGYIKKQKASTDTFREFIKYACTEKAFFEDASATGRLTDILFSNDLVNDQFEAVHFSIATIEINAFVKFLIPFFKSGLIAKIGRSELFYSKDKNLIKAQNLYSSSVDEKFYSDLTSLYQQFQH